MLNENTIKDRPNFGGTFSVEHRNEAGELLGNYEFPNGIVDEGVNHIFDTQFNSGTAVTTWYCSLIDNASFTALANTDVMSSHAGWIESSAYVEATRPVWTSGAAASRSITNGTTMDFSINATTTLKGIFIVSENTKTGTTGVLWATAPFASNVTANNGDTLKVTYSITG